MVWPNAWVDSWDELRAAEDDGNKIRGNFAFDADVAFGGPREEGIQAFARRSEFAIRQSDEFFSGRREADYSLSPDGRSLSFHSACKTGDSENDVVDVHIEQVRDSRGAVVILPHWNAPANAYVGFARYLRLLGITAAVLSLPYHGNRNLKGRAIADNFLSPNLGRTIRSVRQAVLDTKDVLNWLSVCGHRKLGIIGLSLGSCVAGIAAAHYREVCSTSLLLTAGDFAEVVWTGRATRHIRRTLEGHVSLQELQRAWAVISTQSYASKLARDNHHVQIILARRDTVVLPCLSERFVDDLRSATVSLSLDTFPCGHYTLSVFPYGAAAFARLALMLKRRGF